MKTYLKYFFHIVDVEVDSEYDYEGYFKSHFEADQFIRENEEVGNTVTICSPYYEEIQIEPCNLPK